MKCEHGLDECALCHDASGELKDGGNILRLYKITMDHVGHGHCPIKQIAAPDVETAIAAMKQSLDKYDVGKDGKPVGVIAVDTITHIDIIANGTVR